MRYFFYIFLYFLCFLGSFSPVFADETRTQSPFSISDIAKDFDSSYRVMSEKIGASPLILAPFGSVQVFSADSGTKDISAARLVFDVKINEGVVLQDPVLTLENAQNVQEAAFFYPVVRPLNPSKGLFYQLHAAFPFSVKIKNDDAPVSFDVVFSALLCKENACTPVTQKAPFKIEAGKNYYSLYAAFIARAIEFVPTEAPPSQIQMHALNSDSFWIKINDSDDIDEAPIFVLLDFENKALPYSIEYAQVQKNQGLFVLKQKTQTPIAQILIQLPRQVLIKKVELTPAPLPTILFEDAPAKKLPAYLWLLFLFFSPSLVLLFSRDFKNELVARQQLSIDLFQIILGILSAVLIYSVWSYTYLSQSVLWLCFAVVLFAYLAFSAKKLTAFAYGILAAIIPYFAFFAGFDVPLPQTTNALILFFMKIALLNALPFIILFIKPIWAVYFKKITQQMSNNVRSYPLFMDLFLFAYLLLVLIFKVYQ